MQLWVCSDSVFCFPLVTMLCLDLGTKNTVRKENIMVHRRIPVLVIFFVHLACCVFVHVYGVLKVISLNGKMRQNE